MLARHVLWVHGAHSLALIRRKPLGYMVKRTVTSQPQLADNGDRLRGANQRGLFPEAEELCGAVLASQPDKFTAIVKAAAAQ
jgi:hypothetical protein